jgi:hypothetical protein
MVNYMDWVRTSGHGQALQAYNDWVFGPDPVNRAGNPLFVNGTIDGSGVRNESATIYTDDPVIVHIIGANYCLREKDIKGNEIDTDTKIRQACQHSAQNENQLVSVEFKAKQDSNWTNLNAGVEEVNLTPINFEVSTSNPYLKDWDVPMKPGSHRGAWSSKLLLMRIPVAGDYELKFHGTGVQPYEQKAHFKIKVQGKSD